MQPFYEQITSLTHSFCEKFLDEDYKLLAQYATAALCRKKPSPLTSGKKTTWAASILHATSESLCALKIFGHPDPKNRHALNATSIFSRPSCSPS